MKKNRTFEEKKRKQQRAEEQEEVEAATFKRSRNNNAVVYVGNLSPETSVYELKCRFEGFGSISRAKIADNSGHAIVTFRAKEFAEAAIRAALDPQGIIIRNKRVLVSWSNDSLPPWKMGIEVSKLSNDALSKKMPSKITHGREGRGDNRTASSVAATSAAGLRGGNTTADTVRHSREVLVSWANDSLPPWKMGIEVSKLSNDALSKKMPSKIPHGREGRGDNRTASSVAATSAAGLRGGNTTADTVRHSREVVSYDDL